MKSFGAEPEVVYALAARFGDLVADFDAVVLPEAALGDTGDPQVTLAIEHFVQWSRNAITEVSRQCGEVQRVLLATGSGYERAETHILREGGQLFTAAGLVGGLFEDG